jgi:hypothetical protein
MLKRFLKSRWKAARADVKSQKGTALLVALLVMGILTAVSMAVSSMIVRELQITRLALDAGKAYYSAESGVEIALLKLENNLPGFGEDLDGQTILDGGDGASFDLTIENSSPSYPYLIEEDYNFTDAPAYVYYGVLELNESITLPLFSYDHANPDGKKEVKNFVVAYYVKFDSGDLDVEGVDLSSWDVLRWKIYGLTKNTGVEVVTESINDFTAVSTVVAGGGESSTKASQPSWFGSKDPTQVGDWPHKKENILYTAYTISDPVFDQVDGQDVYAGTCLQTEAREHYSYGTEYTGVDVVHCYPIEKFLGIHEYNYLTLTNLMNPAVFDMDLHPTKVGRINLSRIYYRIEAFDGELPREYADITSVGKSGDSEITLNVLKKRDSYLPVFNFALYHTADEEE